MINPEQVHHIFQEELITSGDLWVACLPTNSHRLIDWIQHPDVNILQVETLESRDGILHVRIYLPPTETQIPTIVIGHPSVVGLYAWRDHKPAHPLRSNTPTPLGETNLIWPDDFESLRVVKTMNGGKTSYYVRPSSFLLTDIDFLRLLDSPVKIKRFINVFNGTSFSHITAADEWEDAFPGLGIHGLVTTNSSEYVAAHPEYAFTNVQLIHSVI